LFTGQVALGATGAVLAVVVVAANLLRLRGDRDVSRGGTPELYLHRLRGWTITRFVLVAAALVALAQGGVALAAVALVAGEILGRWLFYVTVVPANMPGSFWRHAAGSHR
jgi:hypothetical protein